MIPVHAIIAHRPFTISRSDVERRLRNFLPEPFDDHFVVVGGRRYPPKQVIAIVTGLDRADFNTHQARQILRRLGFTVGRRSHATGFRAAGADRDPSGATEAELLRPFMGQWVAQRGLDVLVAATTPEAVVEWLERHNQQADAMFRVPTSEADASGIAPA